MIKLIDPYQTDGSSMDPKKKKQKQKKKTKTKTKTNDQLLKMVFKQLSQPFHNASPSSHI